MADCVVVPVVVVVVVVASAPHLPFGHSHFSSCTDSQARLLNTNRKPIAERRQPYVDWEPSKVMNEKYRQSNK